MINQYIVDRTVKTLLLNADKNVNIPSPKNKEDRLAVVELLNLMGLKHKFHSMGDFIRIVPDD